MTIAEYYNITYDVINNNGVWGVSSINNTWNGMIGMLQSKSADIASCLFMTNDRQNVIDYTYPCYSEYITFTSPMPTITHFDNLL
ncbi:unnamed protein product, partial [Oppiella nova]